MPIQQITEADFDERVNQAAQPVVIDFWMANCPPCQTLEPRIEQVARRYQGRVQVYRLDVEESPSIPERYDVMSIPTLLFFKDGAVIKRMDGLITAETLKTAFDEVSS